MQNNHLIAESQPNFMTARELSEMYKIAEASMRTILARPEFNPFYYGHKTLKGIKRKRTADVWDCSGAFDLLIRDYISRMKRRKRKIILREDC